MPDNTDSNRKDDSLVPFTVTADHVVLLKNLNMKTSVTVSNDGDLGYWGLFACRPDVSKKRPFGNSGRPDHLALEELGIEPDEATGEYPREWLDYARLLLIELPMAYEAVMAHGTVEPCTEKICRHASLFEYRYRLALECWRDALEEIARDPAVDNDMLVELAMNVRHGTPVQWAEEIHAMSSHAGWLAGAWETIRKHLVLKYRAANPGDASLEDEAILDGLLSGRLPLEWPGWAERPKEAAP